MQWRAFWWVSPKHGELEEMCSYLCEHISSSGTSKDFGFALTLGATLCPLARSRVLPEHCTTCRLSRVAVARVCWRCCTVRRVARCSSGDIARKDTTPMNGFLA